MYGFWDTAGTCGSARTGLPHTYRLPSPTLPRRYTTGAPRAACRRGQRWDWTPCSPGRLTTASAATRYHRIPTLEPVGHATYAALRIRNLPGLQTTVFFTRFLPGSRERHRLPAALPIHLHNSFLYHTLWFALPAGPVAYFTWFGGRFMPFDVPFGSWLGPNAGRRTCSCSVHSMPRSQDITTCASSTPVSSAPLKFLRISVATDYGGNRVRIHFYLLPVAGPLCGLPAYHLPTYRISLGSLPPFTISSRWAVQYRAVLLDCAFSPYHTAGLHGCTSYHF